MRRDEPTFNLTLEDAEFVVHELPHNDLFTRELWAWIEQERVRRGLDAAYEASE